jgi:ribosomal protein S12 methylthiotransferase
VHDVLQEASALQRAGVKELLVISQDTSAYGVDTKYAAYDWRGQAIKTKFFDLCQALGELGIWVRLHYVYPYPHVDEAVQLMAQGKILPYLDIPFQHASPRILKLMKRPAHSENTLERIKKWRELCPELVIRSTFIVGFPSETEAEFEYLLDWLKEAQLDRVGCFMYSPVEGAKANELVKPIAEDIKQQRYERFMQVQQQISTERLKRRIGQTMTVLVDELEEEYPVAVARSYADAPEIDGNVFVEDIDKSQIKAGDLLEVAITDADEYDLFAKLIRRLDQNSTVAQAVTQSTSASEKSAILFHPL